jgi:DNA-binding transcriptional regulator LsrR (DeoR family)
MTTSDQRLDDAARAGWLYYVAGNTQEQIASKLGVSRQSAQRLVSLAVAKGLVKVTIAHPIANCLTLARRLQDAYGLEFCEVTPTDPGSTSSTLGVSQAAAAEIERWLRRPEPLVMALGTGRTLKAAVELLPTIDCPQHKVISMTGSIAPDGSAAYYNVIFTIADVVTAQAFPMPLPVIASSEQERVTLQAQAMIRSTLDLAKRAKVVFVGVGDLGPEAPLFLDRFFTREELQALQGAGAVGEMVGWAFDDKGRYIEGFTNARVTSAPIPSCDHATVIASGRGERKVPGIRAAMRGRLINGLITDEKTASMLLD